MTALVLLLFLFALLVAALAAPYIGVALYAWLATLYPQNMVWGMLPVSWSMLATAVAALGVFHPALRAGKNSSVIKPMVYLFFSWTIFTTPFADFPYVASGLLTDFSKVIFIFAIITFVTRDRLHLNMFVWALIAGAGAIVLKGFLQFAASGGSSQVIGMPRSEYAGNNEVARLIGTCFPFLLFMSFHASGKYARTVCRFLAYAALLAVIGTFSRGGVLAVAGMLVYWFLYSRHKPRMLLVAGVGFAAALVLFAGPMKERWQERMSTVSEYEEDTSFQGRVFAWNYALDVVEASPIVGAGFGAFRGAIRPNGEWRDAHSIYFEVLGEHGIVGLVLYILLGLTCYLRARRVIKLASTNPSLYWERDLAFACTLSLVFFAIGGLVASTTYNELLFFVVAIIAILDGIVSARTAGPQNALGSPRKSSGSQ